MRSVRTLAVLAMALVAPAATAQIHEILDSSGDGTHAIDGVGVATDGAGNVYAGGTNTHNVIRIAASTTCATNGTPCTRAEILDASGDGSIAHDRTSGIAADSLGNVYVVGQFSDNVWRITNPSGCGTSGSPCVIHEIIGPSGDGVNPLDNPTAVVVDAAENVYVVGGTSDNLFRIAASTTCSATGTPCVITEIIDASGDGTNGLDQPAGLAVDRAGNVFVTSQNSDNVFRIERPTTCKTSGGTPCVITEILDSTGDGVAALDFGRGVATDSEGNVFASGLLEGRIFKVATPGSCSTLGTPCSVTLLLDRTTPGQAGNIVVDGGDNVFAAGGNGDDAIKIDKPGSCSTTGTPCTVTVVVTATGDGVHALDGPGTVALVGADLYVGGGGSDNAFRVRNVAEPLPIFADGFEYGDTTPWSTTLP